MPEPPATSEAAGEGRDVGDGDVGIIGAGIAGAAAARTLRAQGFSATVMDKSRGPGGRLATRRAEADGATLRFDHGAQWFLARDPRFQSFLAEARAAGAAADWSSGPSGAVVGAPGMSALARFALGDTPVLPKFTVETLDRTFREPQRGLQPEAAEGWSAGPFRAVIVTVPSPQAEPLLRGPAPRLADAAKAARYDPCWAFMAAYGWDTDLSAIAHDALAAEGIEWVAFNGSKPGRAGKTLVAHLSGAASRAILDDDKDHVARRVSDIVASRLRLPEPTFRTAHRWRYSRVTKVSPIADPVDASPFVIGVAGDWTRGANVESAFLSGVEAAEAVAMALAAPGA